MSGSSCLAASGGWRGLEAGPINKANENMKSTEEAEGGGWEGCPLTKAKNQLCR